MKLAIWPGLLAALVLAGAGRAPGAPNGGEAGTVSGQEYARLGAWAKAKGLEARWIKRDETVELSGQTSRVVLTVDSREARVNGVLVWLLFPVAARNGTVYLAQLDADKTLGPVLWPARGAAGAKVRTICLDPGHGGKDPGNQVGSKQEKYYTLVFAEEVRRQLDRAGLKVALTRSGDRSMELAERTELARRRRADVFVSLHFNAAAARRSVVQGAEVFCLTPAGASSTNARGEGGGAGWHTGNGHNDQSLALVYQVQKALTRNLAVEDRGVRRARFAVLREAAMPAVLIEAGFMSHPVEGQKIFSKAYREQMARAIVEGLVAYKRLVEGER